MSEKSASPAAKPKAAFSAASFAALRSIAGEGSGEPLRIALDLIDEDPDQPRKLIDDVELTPMVETIRSHGVLQPVGVHPQLDGRYRLAFGARRLRASRLAEQADIPAIVVPDVQRTYASQVIENQQRTNLSNSDLAAAVVQLHGEGTSVEKIGILCNLKEYQVTAYRAVAKFPPFLADRLNVADVRALYDLYRQWRKMPEAVESAMPEAGAFVSITEARRIVGAITGNATGSIVLETRGDEVPEGQGRGHLPAPAPGAPAPEILHGAGFPDSPAQPGSSAKVRKTTTASSSSPSEVADAPALTVSKAIDVKEAQTGELPVFIVAIGEGEHGQLVTDRRAEAPGWALVRYATGIEEVELASLRMVAIE